MKNLKNIIFVLVALFCNTALQSQTPYNQDTEIISGIYDGFDGEHFTFIYTNEEDEEDMILFVKANPDAIKKFNLNNEKFIGKKFNITFISETEIEVDEDGEEQEYYFRTIIDLELLD